MLFKVNKCPNCGSDHLRTFRHPNAQISCKECGFILREEGQSEYTVKCKELFGIGGSIIASHINPEPVSFDQLLKKLKLMREYHHVSLDHNDFLAIESMAMEIDDLRRQIADINSILREHRFNGVEDD